ncbi:hypothetical protein [Jiangella endophytica]|uniref:hypothetical protein n=1 Tax=Jiangella endophytica TaxID=1623398 RepID=UPI001300B8B7|nr:hypothetical protein [Jiangella endophytica]
MNPDQLVALAQVGIDDLARIEAGLAQARVILANADDIATQARESLTALRDAAKGAV